MRTNTCFLILCVTLIAILSAIAIMDTADAAETPLFPHYMVACSDGGSCVRWDSFTGDSWYLAGSMDRSRAWAPIEVEVAEEEEEGEGKR